MTVRVIYNPATQELLRTIICAEGEDIALHLVNKGETFADMAMKDYLANALASGLPDPQKLVTFATSLTAPLASSPDAST